jgi:hypothetical protein
MKVYKLSELNESNLNLQELSKRSREGGLRGDVLVKKLSNQEPITTDITGDIKDIQVTNSEEVVDAITDPSGKYNPEEGEEFFKLGRNYDDVIEGDDDKTYRLNDIKKTTDYGSSQGTSLGTLATREVETIQCLILAYRQKKDADLTHSDIDTLLDMSEAVFKGYVSYVSSSVELTQDILSKYCPDWTSTFIKTANALYQRRIRISETNKEAEILKKRITYRFYQISSKEGICGAIKNAFNKFQTEDDKPNLSKWNPADVWAVDMNSEEEIIREINNHQSITGLNSIVDAYFDGRKLLGISLKKIPEDQQIKLVINKMTRPPKYEFVSIKLAEDPFSTSSLRIAAQRRSFAFGDVIEYMTVRSFAGSKVENISGEVAGKSARQGKISLTKINEILFKCTGEVVPTIGEIGEWSDKQLRDEIEAINNLISRKYGNINPTGRKYQPSRARLTSKYQALYLAWILLENDEKVNDDDGGRKIDQAIEQIFHYALSIRFGPKKSERTPKYVRVID